MKPISIIQFTDIDSNDEAVIIVRASEEHLALAISLKEDGDIEVVFPAEICDSLIEALQQAKSLQR